MRHVKMKKRFSGCECMEFNKLVRDKTPELIEAEGFVPNTRILAESEFLDALDAKLAEEVKEYSESKSLEEMADILEVLFAICEARGYSADLLFKTRAEKAEQRGGFSKRIFLISKEP